MMSNHNELQHGTSDQSPIYDNDEESLQRALADVELMTAAFPEEVSQVSDCASTKQLDYYNNANSCSPKFIQVQLQLSNAAIIVLEIPTNGYPETSPMSIASYRSSPDEKEVMEKIVTAIRNVITTSYEDQTESGFASCTLACEIWNAWKDETEIIVKSTNAIDTAQRYDTPNKSTKYNWISGEPLVDRKSTFVAHACRIKYEADVQQALSALLANNSKLQRATHNMYAYRLHECLPENGNMLIGKYNKNDLILKHDNDDDGESGAGAKLAHLLQVRNEDGVLVVVSRWFGGIHLGPKRFAHISNVARDLLVYCHAHLWEVK